MPNDKFGNPFFYPSKEGGVFFQLSNDPNDDDWLGFPDEVSNIGNGQFTIKPNGPTDWEIAKNPGHEADCDMDFGDVDKRGYASKADDPRDVEIKFLAKFSGLGDHGFSIGGPTGSHSGSGCCGGFAYMVTIEVGKKPSTFTFRKEIWHVQYDDSPEGELEHDDLDFKIDGHGWVGLGYCRYNKTVSGKKDAVVLEFWFNPTPEDDPKNWILGGRVTDRDGNGWSNGGGKCGGAKDQVGRWSATKFRMKTNSESGSIVFKNVTMREIDPEKEFDEEPSTGGGGTTGGGSVQRNIHYCIIRGQSPQDYKGIMRTLTEELVETQTDPDPQDEFDGKAFCDWNSYN